jgi:hypothetical protein
MTDSRDNDPMTDDLDLAPTRTQARRLVALLTGFWLLWGIGVACWLVSAVGVGVVPLVAAMACLFVFYGHLYSTATGRTGMAWGFLLGRRTRRSARRLLWRPALQVVTRRAELERTGWPVRTIRAGWALLLCADLGLFAGLLLSTHTGPRSN